MPRYSTRWRDFALRQRARSGQLPIMRQFFPLSALLLGAAFLFIAGGMHALILPLRGTEEGFDDLSLGLLGAGWAIGYVLGCLFVPRLVSRVGHIRPFGVMATAASLSILLSLLLIDPWAWIGLRALAGFAFAGAAMIIESWLSEASSASSRGKVYGVYAMVNLAGLTAGQLMIMVEAPSGFFFFVLAAVFYNLALIPTALSSSAAPKPLTRTRLDLRMLWRNSPVAVVSVFLVGFSNGSFGTLAAVYGLHSGLDRGATALFVSMPILAGALVQMPVGYLSDRIDRRFVLIGVAGAAMLGELIFILFSTANPIVAIAIAAIVGGGIYSLYPVIIAHANDFAEPDDYIRTSGGLLLLFGIGSIFGPLAAGYVMSRIGSSGLFLTMLAAHVLLVAFVILRIRTRQTLSTEEKTDFVITPADASHTPETVAMKVEAISEREGKAAAAERTPGAAEDADMDEAETDEAGPGVAEGKDPTG